MASEIKTDYYSDLVSNAVQAKQNMISNGNELDRDAFLNLLVAEMSNQDPLNPMQDSEFIAQLAQFSALEQMENMNTSTIQSRGMSLIGQNIVASAGDGTGQYIRGTVDSVIYNAGKTYLNIDGTIVSIDNIKEVTGAAVQSDDNNNDETAGDEKTEDKKVEAAEETVLSE